MEDHLASFWLVSEFQKCLQKFTISSRKSNCPPLLNQSLSVEVDHHYYDAEVALTKIVCTDDRENLALSLRIRNTHVYAYLCVSTGSQLQAFVKTPTWLSASLTHIT